MSRHLQGKTVMRPWARKLQVLEFENLDYLSSFPSFKLLQALCGLQGEQAAVLERLQVTPSPTPTKR